MKLRHLLVLVTITVLASCGADDTLTEGTDGNWTVATFAALPTRERAGVGGSIQYFEVDEFPPSTVAIRESDEPLSVVDYGPVGELPTENRRPSVFVTFSQPIVPLARLGEPLRSSGVVQIEPDMSGVFRWFGSRTLSFEPDEPFSDQRAYTVTVRDATESLGGKRLGEEVSFTFYNEPLEIAALYPGTYRERDFIDPTDAPPEALTTITIQFNYPVDIDFVSDFLTYRSAGLDHDLSLRRPEGDDLDPSFVARTVVMEVAEPVPVNTEVLVTLAAGAASRAGAIGREEPSIHALHSLRPFEYRELTTYSWSIPRSPGGDSNPVFLHFSHPIDAESVVENIAVDLPVEDLAEYVTVWDNVIRLSNLPVEYESTYAVRLLPDLRDVHGRVFGRDGTVEVEVPAAATYYHFPNSGSRMLEAQYAPQIIFEHQNVESGVWRVDRIADPFRAFTAASLEPYDFSYQEPNTKHFRVLDLSPWLNADGFGFVGLGWNFSAPDSNGTRRSWRQTNLQLQVTDLGVTTRYAFNRIVVWVKSLSSGEAVADAAVTVGHGFRPVLEGLTDGDGVVRFDLEPGQYRALFVEGREDRIQISVRHGSDRVAFRPNRSHNTYPFGIWNVGGPHRAEAPRMETFLFTDRGLYQPGETVTFRGIDRTYTPGGYEIFEGPYTLEVRENRWDGEVLTRLSGETTDSGGLFGEIALPETLEPGSYVMEYARQTMRTGRTFQVAHFERAAFDVAVAAPERSLFLGEAIGMTVRSRYLAGGSLAGQPYTYFWQRAPAHYAPPGARWRGWIFGPEEFGWGTVLSRGEGVLSAAGAATSSQITDANVPVGRAQRYTLEARVQDAAQREIAGRASALVHPAALYTALRLETGGEAHFARFVESGTPVELSIATVDIDGEVRPPANETVDVTFIRRVWQSSEQRGVYGRVNTRWERVDEEVFAQTVEMTDGRGTLTLTSEEAGEYLIRVDALDSAGRAARTELSFYATGSSWIRWGIDDRQAIRLVPDRERYSVGDTARVMVQSPLPEGEYLVTLERDGIFESRLVELEGSAATIDIPITEEIIPVVYVTVSSSRERQEAPTSYFEPDLGKPAGYFGIVRLVIDPEPRSVEVEILPDEPSYRPGEEASVEVAVHRDGTPVEGAEVTLLAVDRGVLDLINYHIPDPVEFFYDPAKFTLNVVGADSRSLLIDPVTYEIKNLVGGDDGAGKLDRRDDFSPLAVFEPYLETDASGIARARFQWPDTLTTYRLTAVVVNHNDFGIAEEEIAVRNPLNVRAALPRRLRVRDTAEVGVVLTNLAGDGIDVEVALSAAGLTVDGERRKTVTIGPESTVPLYFTVAAREVGRAELEFTVRSSALSEVLVETIEIERPLVREAFTVTGRTERAAEERSQSGIDQIAEEGLIIPTNIAEGFGSVTVRARPSRLPEFVPAIEYLLEHRSDYVDAHILRAVPRVLFGDALEEMGLDGAHLDEERLHHLLGRLADVQGDDGGIPYSFQRLGVSSPRSSIWTALLVDLIDEYGALTEADGEPSVAGSSVEMPDIDALLGYLESLHNRPHVSDFTRLFALYVQARLGEDVEAHLERLTARGDEIGAAGLGFAALAHLEAGRDGAAESLLQRMRSFTTLGTRSIDFLETYEVRHYFDSPTLRLAQLLMLYNRFASDPTMTTRVADTVMNNQRFGFWNNVADTAWVLIAFADTIRSDGSTDVDLDLSVAISGDEMVRRRFESVTDAPLISSLGLFDVPLVEAARNVQLPLTFAAAGAGTAYYSATIEYALPAEIVPPRDEGISVLSAIRDLEGNPVLWDELDLGETYRMEVTIATPRTRHMVELSVPVPSGAAIVDASFATSGSYGESGGVNTRVWRRETQYGDTQAYVGEGTIVFSPFDVVITWFEPVTRIYDNEIRYTFDQLYPGSQTVTFLFRTTTTGIYPTPPAQARLVYEEEVFGRSRGNLAIVEAR